MWLYVDTLLIVIGYSVIAGYALAFVWVQQTPWAIRLASLIGLGVASWILIGRLMILVDPALPSIGLTAIFLHPLMSRLRAHLGMLALLAIYMALGHWLLRR